MAPAVPVFAGAPAPTVFEPSLRFLSRQSIRRRGTSCTSSRYRTGTGRYGQRPSGRCVSAPGGRGCSAGRVHGRGRGGDHGHGCSQGHERGVVGTLQGHSGM